MNKIFILLILIAFLFAGCTSEQQDINYDVEGEREELNRVAQEYLEENSNNRDLIQDNLPDYSNVEEEAQDNEQQEISVNEGSQSSIIEEEFSQRDNDIDIEVYSLSITGERNFDVDDEDDEVRFEVDLDTVGLEDGESFIIEVIARKDGEEADRCQMIFIVGDSKDYECSMDDFTKYGRYYAEVYADIKEKHSEEDKDNNYLREEFDLED